MRSFKDRKRIIFDRGGTIPIWLDTMCSKDRKNFPSISTLHKVLESDESHLDRLGLGCFNFKRWVLGTYTQGKFWRGPWILCFRKAEDPHWLELAKDKDGKNIPCWSLFYMAKKRKDWDPKVDGKWIPT